MSKKFAICYNPDIKNSKEAMEKLNNLLHTYKILPDVLTIDNMNAGYDFVFVIGGDGTILKTARFYSKTATPIFGINLGHLGFLSQAGSKEIEKAITDITLEEYKVEKRLMLETENHSALNDIVIKGEEPIRASSFKLEIDDKFVCEYFADGIIIATPTGSTAYNMAAGGPVVTPELEILTIVPICPHTFAARPLVVSSNSKITIYAPNNQIYCASCDGQDIFKFKNKISINKSQNYANLVLLNNNDFYTVLRNKLHWGISPERNH